MAQYTRDGITFDIGSGSGNTVVTVTAEVNEGLDKSETFTVSADGGDVSTTLTVNQEGRREIFSEDFRLNDGTSFNVIKEGYV